MSEADATPKVTFFTAAGQPWGAEHSLAILVQALRGSIAPTIVCSSTETAEFFSMHTGAQVICLNESENRLKVLARFMRTAFSHRKSTALVIFSLQLMPLIPLIRVLTMHTPRLVVDLHDVPKGRFDRWASRFCSRFAHVAIAISNYVANAFPNQGRTQVVPRPFLMPHSAPVFNPLGDKLSIGIVGRIDPEKRIETAIAAISKCPEQVSLKVYGASLVADAGYRARLVSTAKRAVDSRVEFMGVRKPDDIYGAIDAIIVCNENEPSGRTVGEAMMAGLLPVVPDSGGSSEFLPPSMDWLKYEALNPESAAGVIRAILKLPKDEFRTWRELAYEWVCATRNPTAIGEAYRQAVLGM